MNKLADLLPIKSALHHAYLLIGEPAEAILQVKDYLNERFGTAYANSANPDFWMADLPTWGIEESRNLKEAASRRPVEYPAKVFVISAHLVTLEAQNSLLKTLEEPAPDTHFFIIAKQASLFLPTVLSRCQLIELSSEEVSIPSQVSNFLRADIAERLKIVKEILKAQEDDAAAGVNFLNDLAREYWQKVRFDLSPEKRIGAEVLNEAATLASQRGSSLRLLLDHVAGVVPVL